MSRNTEKKKTKEERTQLFSTKLSAYINQAAAEDFSFLKNSNTHSNSVSTISHLQRLLNDIDDSQIKSLISNQDGAFFHLLAARHKKNGADTTHSTLLDISPDKGLLYLNTVIKKELSSNYSFDDKLRQMLNFLDWFETMKPSATLQNNADSLILEFHLIHSIFLEKKLIKHQKNKTLSPCPLMKRYFECFFNPSPLVSKIAASTLDYDSKNFNLELFLQEYLNFSINKKELSLFDLVCLEILTSHPDQETIKKTLDRLNKTTDYEKILEKKLTAKASYKELNPNIFRNIVLLKLKVILITHPHHFDPEYFLKDMEYPLNSKPCQFVCVHLLTNAKDKKIVQKAAELLEKSEFDLENYLQHSGHILSSKFAQSLCLNLLINAKDEKIIRKAAELLEKSQNEEMGRTNYNWVTLEYNEKPILDQIATYGLIKPFFEVSHFLDKLTEADKKHLLDLSIQKNNTANLVYLFSLCGDLALGKGLLKDAVTNNCLPLVKKLLSEIEKLGKTPKTSRKVVILVYLLNIPEIQDKDDIIKHLFDYFKDKSDIYVLFKDIYSKRAPTFSSLLATIKLNVDVVNFIVEKAMKSSELGILKVLFSDERTQALITQKNYDNAFSVSCNFLSSHPESSDVRVILEILSNKKIDECRIKNDFTRLFIEENPKNVDQFVYLFSYYGNLALGKTLLKDAVTNNCLPLVKKLLPEIEKLGKTPKTSREVLILFSLLNIPEIQDKDDIIKHLFDYFKDKNDIYALFKTIYSKRASTFSSLLATIELNVDVVNFIAEEAMKSSALGILKEMTSDKRILPLITPENHNKLFSLSCEVRSPNSLSLLNALSSQKIDQNTIDEAFKKLCTDKNSENINLESLKKQLIVFLPSEKAVKTILKNFIEESLRTSDLENEILLMMRYFLEILPEDRQKIYDWAEKNGYPSWSLLKKAVEDDLLKPFFKKAYLSPSLTENQKEELLSFSTKKDKLDRLISFFSLCENLPLGKKLLKDAVIHNCLSLVKALLPEMEKYYGISPLTDKKELILRYLLSIPKIHNKDDIIKHLFDYFKDKNDIYALFKGIYSKRASTFSSLLATIELNVDVVNFIVEEAMKSSALGIIKEMTSDKRILPLITSENHNKLFSLFCDVRSPEALTLLNALSSQKIDQNTIDEAFKKLCTDRNSDNIDFELFLKQLGEFVPSKEVVKGTIKHLMKELPSLMLSSDINSHAILALKHLFSLLNEKDKIFEIFEDFFNDSKDKGVTTHTLFKIKDEFNEFKNQLHELDLHISALKKQGRYKDSQSLTDTARIIKENIQASLYCCLQYTIQPQEDARKIFEKQSENFKKILHNKYEEMNRHNKPWKPILSKMIKIFSKICFIIGIYSPKTKQNFFTSPKMCTKRQELIDKTQKSVAQLHKNLIGTL